MSGTAGTIGLSGTSGATGDGADGTGLIAVLVPNPIDYADWPERYGLLAPLLAAPEAEIAAIPRVGPVRAAGIARWRVRPENLEIVAKLHARGVRPEPPSVPGEGLPLAGHTFLITGRLEGYTRIEAENALEALGAKIANNVSKTLGHLIVGDEPGSKLTKAQKLRVAVHDEAWLAETLRLGALAPAPDPDLPAIDGTVVEATEDTGLDGPEAKRKTHGEHADGDGPVQRSRPL